MQPRGIRNNNPLNIRIGNKWKGEVANPTDKDFEQFVSMDYGLRAAFLLLRRYINHYHVNTIWEIISRWAPARENNTAAYVRRVCDRLNVGALIPISFSDRQTMVALVCAMAEVENGQPIDEELVNQAYMKLIWELEETKET